MSEKLGPTNTRTPGGRRQSLPKSAYWPRVWLVVASAIRILVCGEVDLAGLSILAAGLFPLVRFRNDW
jgi:hypothetical protein